MVLDCHNFLNEQKVCLRVGNVSLFVTGAQINFLVLNHQPDVSIWDGPCLEQHSVIHSGHNSLDFLNELILTVHVKENSLCDGQTD